MGDITSKITDGSHNPPPNNLSGIPILSAANIFDGKIQFSSATRWISEKEWDIENKRTEIQLNDVLLTIVGTIGRTAIVKSNDKFALQRSVAVLKPIQIYSEYISYALQSTFLLDLMILNSKGTAQKGIYLNTLKELIFPLPPLLEQHRIVQKIEELLPLVERYDQTEQKLTKLNDTFPEQLKKSVLQAAIQGKLTEQLPTDEPASELLKRIETEKMRLISEGKLKKPKLRDNSQNTKFEPPFEIPQGWEWVKLGDLFEINPRNKLDGELTVSFIPMNLIEDGYKNAHTSQIRQWKEIKSGFTHFAENDLAVAKITPCFENRKSVIFQNLENKFGAGTTELFIFRSIGDIANINYLFWFVKSHYFINGGVKSYSGTAGQQRVSSDYIKNCLFPLPPLEEQKRIVEKVELLLSQIERL